MEGYEVAFQITAPGYETVTHTAMLTIQPRDLSQCTVSGIGSSYTYTGEPITTPHAAVTDGSRLLTQGQDYTVTYGVNQNVGEYNLQEETAGRSPSPVGATTPVRSSKPSRSPRWAPPA